MHIVIAPDKFKGSLTSTEAAAAIRAGFARVFPAATFDLLPLADGGEGVLEAFSRGAPGAQSHTVNVKNALGHEVRASFLLSGKTAVIESSQANGLYLIPQEDRDIARANTFGVGQLILAAAAAGAEQILIGIGGSATNDAALGLAAALGCTFLDTTGTAVDPIPANIRRIARIDSSSLTTLPPSPSPAMSLTLFSANAVPPESTVHKKASFPHRLMKQRPRSAISPILLTPISRQILQKLPVPAQQVDSATAS